jgi:hypothetical protein
MVVFIGCDGEPVDPETLRSSYPDMPVNDGYAWGQWRPATLDELVKTWPSRSDSKVAIESKIWWQPTLDELRLARKAASALERMQISASVPQRQANADDP